MASEKRKARGGGGETVRTLVYALALALTIRVLAYEPFSVPSGSMMPTLLVGDYFFVSKYAYGYSRHSIPFSLPLFRGRVFGAEPQRGDVIVFKTPEDNRTDYVKRVIGLPEDRIQVRDGVVYVNDVPIERRRLESDQYRAAGGESALYEETMPNGARYLTLDRYSSSQDNTEVFVVRSGHYFMMGDNRDNSRDSRFENEVGQVPVENLVGRAEVIFFSGDGTARWWQVWKWPWAIRYARTFDSLRT